MPRLSPTSPRAGELRLEVAGLAGHLGEGGARARPGERVVEARVDLRADQIRARRRPAGPRPAGRSRGQQDRRCRAAPAAARRAARRPSGTASRPPAGRRRPSILTVAGRSPGAADRDPCRRAARAGSRRSAARAATPVGRARRAAAARAGEGRAGSRRAGRAPCPGRCAAPCRRSFATSPVVSAKPTGDARAHRGLPARPGDHAAPGWRRAGPRPASRPARCATARSVIFEVVADRNVPIDASRATPTRHPERRWRPGGARRWATRPREPAQRELIAALPRARSDGETAPSAHLPALGQPGGDRRVVGGDDERRVRVIGRASGAHRRRGRRSRGRAGRSARRRGSDAARRRGRGRPRPAVPARRRSPPGSLSRKLVELQPLERRRALERPPAVVDAPRGRAAARRSRPRQRRQQARALEHDRDRARAQRFAGPMRRPLDRAHGRLVEPRHQVQQGRLAGAGRSCQADPRPLRDLAGRLAKRHARRRPRRTSARRRRDGRSA